MSNTKQKAAFKRELNKKSSAKASSKKLSPAEKGWATKRAKEEAMSAEYLRLADENNALKKEVEILNSAIKSCESELLKKENGAAELYNKRTDLTNEIERLEYELKLVDDDIINMKAKLNSELNILG